MNTGHALITALCKEYAIDKQDVIETHISWVLLSGDYAYKIKKPVNFGFLDFSTLAKRYYFCTEELRLNRRLAGDIYLEVVPICQNQTHTTFAGTGEIVEYALKMLRFPALQELSVIAQAKMLQIAQIDQLSEIIANFHGVIARSPVNSSYGESEVNKYWFAENFAHIRPLLFDAQAKVQLQTLETWGEGEWLQKAKIMDLRKQQGFVRECHGDLHLGNVTQINGKPTLFDCIEFNPVLRWIDVISEVAFLFMDLLHFNYEHYAYRFLNRYLQCTGDYVGLSVFRYYLVYRALVRAKVSLLRSAQVQKIDLLWQTARAEYAMYIDIASYMIQQQTPILIVTHGFSGSGKSTLAKQLAEQINALHIRSDIERKRLFGYQAQDNTHSAVQGGIYDAEKSGQTYGYLAELAAAVLNAGFSCIVDATFLKLEQRTLFKQLAAQHQTKFFLIDVHASDKELCRRIAQRQGDVSEATIEVLLEQQRTTEALTDAELKHVIRYDSEKDAAISTILYQLDVKLTELPNNKIAV